MSQIIVPHPKHYLQVSEDRERYITALEKALEQANQKQVCYWMLAIRIDNLPMIRSIYGNNLGEQLIDSLQKDIGHVSSNISQIYRITYNQLALIAYDETIEDIRALAKKINSVCQHFGSTVSEAQVHITTSIGAISFPDIANNITDIINFAYIAQSHARQSNSLYFASYNETEPQRQQTKNHMILANYFLTAIQEKRLRLAYQPIVDSKTGNTKSYECLLRIINQEGKVTSAGSFIPVAEHLGFIDVVDDLVLEMVVQELHTNPDVLLSLNISSITINNKDWLDKAMSLLADPNIASRLTIEITETAIQRDIEHVVNFIVTLQKLGCQIALDDFGAGYTSFRQLKSLPIDIVKIDGYFVKDMVENIDNQLFVKTLLDFVKGLGLKAVAEFVETGEIAKLLMELEVDYMQGNYFCPAVNYRSWVNDEAAS